jgi:hypothetical protein
MSVIENKERHGQIASDENAAGKETKNEATTSQ